MSFSKNGFEIIDNILTANELNPIKLELEQLALPILTAGVRNADKKFPSIDTLITSKKLLDKAKGYLKGKPSVVCVILFDKTICVSEKKEINDWGPWSLKDGIHHVQPPLNTLNQMVTFRIHLDNSTLETGYLRVIPKSHSQGILSNSQIQEIASKQKAVDCVAEAGLSW